MESKGIHLYYNQFTDFLGEIHHSKPKPAHAVNHTPTSSEFGHHSSSSQDALLPLPCGHSPSPSLSPGNALSLSLSRPQSPNTSEFSSPRPAIQVSYLNPDAHGQSSPLLSDMSSSGEDDVYPGDHYWDARMLMTHPPRLASDSSVSLRSPSPISLTAPPINVIPPSTANSRAPSPSDWGDESPLSPSTRNLVNLPT